MLEIEKIQLFSFLFWSIGHSASFYNWMQNCMCFPLPPEVSLSADPQRVHASKKVTIAHLRLSFQRWIHGRSERSTDYSKALHLLRSIMAPEMSHTPDSNGSEDTETVSQFREARALCRNFRSFFWSPRRTRSCLWYLPQLDMPLLASLLSSTPWAHFVSFISA